MWDITRIDDEYGRSVEMRSIEQITTIFLDDYSELSQRRFNVYKLCYYESYQRSVHEQWYVRAALYILSWIFLFLFFVIIFKFVLFSSSCCISLLFILIFPLSFLSYITLFSLSSSYFLDRCFSFLCFTTTSRAR